jgi:hypothetical protein
MLEGIKFVRYCQNLARNTMYNFKKLQALTKEDLTGDVLQVANRVGVAPVIVIRQLLQLDGLSKRDVKNVIEGTIPPPEYLKESLRIALENDPVFSPQGIQISKKRGSLGEDLIDAWLKPFSIDYTRDIGQGGPDFLFKSPLTLNICGIAKEIHWIESKASYGDAFQVKRNKAQFRRYDVLGTGIVFYWFGCEERIEWDVFTWESLTSRVDYPLNERIVQFISFVPYEFKHLIYPNYNINI